MSGMLAHRADAARYRAGMAKASDPDASLKRLGGGRWQTRDERFTIEPQSGTWAVVDSEQTDDFGMPLVRGPYPSLTAAKEAIAGARTSEPATSPLAERIEHRRRARPATEKAPAKAPPRRDARLSDREPVKRAHADREADDGSDDAPRKAPARAASRRAAADEPPEPAWVAELAATDRG